MTLKEQIFADVFRVQYERSILDPDFDPRWASEAVRKAIAHALEASEQASEAFEKANYTAQVAAETKDPDLDAEPDDIPF